MLLAAAATIAALAIPAPGQAQQFSGQSFGGNHRGFPRAAASDRQGFDCGARSGRHDRRGEGRGRGACGDGVLVSYGGEWALYNNRSWESDSYNDWWHDRPDRAFPRWVRHNQDCAPERMWWSGEGWHC